MEKLLFVNPNAHANRNIPNLALAYAATFFHASVVDLNAWPDNGGRYRDLEAETLVLSVQSRTLNESRRLAESYLLRYPNSSVKNLKGFVDVQCCYPYIQIPGFEVLEYTEPFSDAYPFPNFELFDSFPVFKKHWKKGDWSYTVLTSLGCPFQCTYCSAHNRAPVKFRSVDNVIEELREAKRKWGFVNVDILDDVFNLKKSRVLEFCEKIKPLKIKWNCANGLRADLLDEEDAKALVGAGCEHASFGVESADPEVLAGVNKGESIEQIEKGVKIAKKYFKSVNTYLIIGLPGSNFEKDLKSVSFVKKLGVNGHFSYCVPQDKNTEDGALFYGEGARPLSDAYPVQEQERIYNMTRYMRPGVFGVKNLASKVYTVFRELTRS